MKRLLTISVRTALAALMLSVICRTPYANAQGIHFSQYYNAPMLASPSNTGLMSDRNYRVCADYRTQWGAVPVPFTTFAVQGDLQVFRRHNGTNWLGLGGAALSDKSGDGNLSMGRYEGFAAYHIELGDKQMVSFGASVAAVQRSVDFSKLYFDAQWDGFNFNTNLPNNEKGTLNKTSYMDISAGISYSVFPTDLLYIKVGAGLAHLNQPRESFLNQSNQVGFRPSANIDALARIGVYVIANPSVYYTSQKGAWELMYGSLFLVNVGKDESDGRLIVGAFHRLNDAIVASFGYEWHGLRLIGSYDYTISGLGQYINHNGAMEVGLRWTGKYKVREDDKTREYKCPKF